MLSDGVKKAIRYQTVILRLPFLPGADAGLGIHEFLDEDASEAVHAFGRRGYLLPVRRVCGLRGLRFT